MSLGSRAAHVRASMCTRARAAHILVHTHTHTNTYTHAHTHNYTYGVTDRGCEAAGTYHRHRDQGQEEVLAGDRQPHGCTHVL